MANLADRLHGAIPALPTPFRDGAVDWAALEAVALRALEAGVQAVLVNGSTAETAALDDAERVGVIRAVTRLAEGRALVIAGAGTDGLQRSAGRLAEAAEAGADAALVVAPYYVKPNPAGLLAYMEALADRSDLAIILYDNPGRAGCAFGVATQAAASRHPRLVGVKDSTGDMAKATALRRACTPDYVLLSGDDPTSLGFLAHGGAGCISVTANVAPKLCVDMQEAWRRGDVAQARDLHERLAPLHDALLSDSNPAPLKHALERLGLSSGELRLPLATASDTARRAIDHALADLELV